MGALMLTAYPQTEISIFADGSLQVEDLPVLPPFTYYRQPHDVELTVPGVKASSPERNYRGNSNGTAREVNAASIPEVYQLIPEHVTPLSSAWVELVCAVNYELPREQA